MSFINDDSDNTQREDKKAILLEAAMKIYAKQGDFTARELAAESGMNTAALNYYFNSKQALIELIELKLLDVFVEEIELRGGSDLKAEERLYELLLAVNNRLRDNPGLARHFVNRLLEGQARIFQLLESALGPGSPIHSTFAAILREAGIKNTKTIEHRLIIAISALAPTLFAGFTDISSKEIANLRLNEFNEAHLQALAQMLLADDAKHETEVTGEDFI